MPEKLAKHAAPECQHLEVDMFERIVHDDDSGEEWFVTVITCSDCGKRVY